MAKLAKLCRHGSRKCLHKIFAQKIDDINHSALETKSGAPQNPDLCSMQRKEGDLMSSDFTMPKGVCGKACASEQPSRRR